MVHNNIAYKVKMSNYTACNVKTVKTLRRSSQKRKIGILILRQTGVKFC